MSEKIQNKQVDTIIRAFVHHLPTEPAKVNFCSAMESLDTQISSLTAKLKVAEEALEKIIKITTSPGMVDPFGDGWQWFYKCQTALTQLRQEEK